MKTAGGEGVSGLAPRVLGTQDLSLYSALLSSQATCVAPPGDVLHRPEVLRTALGHQRSGDAEVKKPELRLSHPSSPSSTFYETPSPHSTRPESSETSMRGGLWVLESFLTRTKVSF